MSASGPQRTSLVARLEAFAQALATGVTPVQAARIAGYPNGSCFAHNARKRARLKDVKAMVAELKQPVKEKLAKTIEANFEWATKQLLEVGNLPIGISNVRASDKIRAIEVLAKMHGWYAPEKTNLTGDWKRRVRLNVTYTVEPKPQEENPT
jgi:hypothetical protein